MSFRIFFYFVFCITFLGLAAELDTLQELATECFSKQLEYITSLPQRPTIDYFNDVVHLVTFEEFNKIIKEFDATNKKMKSDKKIDLSCDIQKIKVPSGSKICFMGDIHGSIHSLLRNLLRLFLLGYLQNDFSISKDKNLYMVFLGDYLDRGRYGMDAVYTLLKLKLKNMNNVFLLRGNHEINNIYSEFTFLYEYSYSRKAAEEQISSELIGDEQLKEFFDDPFCKNLLLALFIGSGNNTAKKNEPFWIQCCHGGIEPSFNPKSFLNEKSTEFKKFIENGEEAFSYEPYDKERISQETTNFLWYHIQENIEELKETNGFTWCDFTSQEPKGFVSDERRIYNLRGKDLLNSILGDFGIKAVFRGHQHSYFGLKLGGDPNTQIEPEYKTKWHWTSFDKFKDEVNKKDNQNGFKINAVDYPVFTFSTACEGVSLPYDCFAILTTANKWEDWSLLPFEFERPTEAWGPIVEGRWLSTEGRYLKITGHDKGLRDASGALIDPIIYTHTKKSAGYAAIPDGIFDEKSSLNFKLKILKKGLVTLKQKLKQLSEKINFLNDKLFEASVATAKEISSSDAEIGLSTVGNNDLKKLLQEAIASTKGIEAELAKAKAIDEAIKRMINPQKEDLAPLKEHCDQLSECFKKAQGDKNAVREKLTTIKEKTKDMRVLSLFIGLVKNCDNLMQKIEEINKMVAKKYSSLQDSITNIESEAGWE